MATTHGSSTFQAAANILKVCTGAGLLALPHAFQLAGVTAGIIGVAVVVLLNAVSCRLLIRCKNAYLESHGLPDETSDSHPKDTYGQLAYASFGTIGTLLVQASLIITLLGASTVYVITSSRLMHEVWPQYSVNFLILATALTLSYVVLIRSMTFLSWSSMLGLFCYAVALFSIFFYGSTTYSASLPVETVETGHFHQMMQFFGVIIFSLGIPCTALILQESMQEPHKFLMVLDRTLFFVFVAFVSIGVGGMALFSHAPEGIQPMIISNMPSSSFYSMAVKLAMSYTLVLSVPLCLVPSLNLIDAMLLPGTKQRREHRGPEYGPARLVRTRVGDIEAQEALFRQQQQEEAARIAALRANGKSEKPRIVTERTSLLKYSSINEEGASPIEASAADTWTLWFQRLGVRLLVLGIVIAAAIAVPCFPKVMSIIGCFTLSLLCFIFPPLFFIRLSQKGYMTLASRLSQTLCGLFAATGLFIMFSSMAIVMHGKCE